METENGAPGRFHKTGAAFDSLAITLDSFCDTDKSGAARILSSTDERFSRRSLTLRRNAYIG
jgi:hypothetical protein